MKTLRLLPLATLILLVAGCASTASKVAHAPTKAEARFTLDHLEAAQVDVPAKPTKIARANGRLPQSEDGRATVQYIVDTTGRPREVQWTEASDPAFGRAAVALLEQARFKPAMKNGAPVAVKMETQVASHVHGRIGFQSGDQRFDRTHYTEEASIYPHDIDPFTGH